MAIKNLLHHLNLRSTRLLPRLTLTSKIVFSFFIIISSSFFIKSILATVQTYDISNAVKKLNEKQEAISDDSQDQKFNLETWGNENLMGTATSINKAIGGKLEIVPSNNEASTSASINWKPSGLIGLTNSSIASLYQSPASGVQYIADSINSFLNKPAYAQETSFGFTRLNGILSLWKKTRDIAYTIVSLFFISLGVMIILKIKVNPQTTITVQSSIPKIISSLILITFSYAIAGLIIDFSYIIMGIVLNIFSETESTTSIMSMDFGGFYSYLTNNIVPTAVLTSITGVAGLITFFILAASSAGIGALALILGITIIFIIILIQVIKFFIGIAKCYINLIIRIILGPLEICMGAIPGSKLNFSSWIKNITANIAVFPISVIFLVLLSNIINTCKTNNIWAPPILGNGDVIAFVLGIAGLFILSKLPELIPQIAFNLKPSPIGKALDENLAPVKKIASTSIRAGAQYGANESQKMGPLEKPLFKTLRQVGELTGYIKNK